MGNPEGRSLSSNIRGGNELKITVGGDSHGRSMIGVLEGMPAGMRVDVEKIDLMLRRRRGGFGRGERMKLEDDHAEIVAGLWKGVTTGAPIVIAVNNKGRANPVSGVRSVPRPGHVDYAAWRRYKLSDLNAYAERSSARWTVVFTALGALAKQFLESFEIILYSYVCSIGRVKAENVPDERSELIKRRDASRVYCPNSDVSDRMCMEIEKAMSAGDSLGGSFRVVAENVPAGLGSYSDIFEKLDSKIGAYFMSIPAVKGVFIGSEKTDLFGSSYHDPFDVEKGIVVRKSNNAGGIEGGITNGESIIVTAYVKPVPTLKAGLQSVDLRSMKKSTAPYVRSDVCVVPAASVVGEATLALILLEVFLKRYGDDNMKDIRRRYRNEVIPRWDDGFWKDDDR